MFVCKNKALMALRPDGPGPSGLTRGQSAVGIARVCAILQMACFVVGTVQSAKKKSREKETDLPSSSPPPKSDPQAGNHESSAGSQ